MRRDQAIAALRGFLPALRREFGVRRVALFGSTPRDEAREDSDLDLLVEFELVPTLDRFVGLKLYLEHQTAPESLPSQRPITSVRVDSRRLRGGFARFG